MAPCSRVPSEDVCDCRRSRCIPQSHVAPDPAFRTSFDVAIRSSGCRKTIRPCCCPSIIRLICADLVPLVRVSRYPADFWMSVMVASRRAMRRWCRSASSIQPRARHRRRGSGRLGAAQPARAGGCCRCGSWDSVRRCWRRGRRLARVLAGRTRRPAGLQRRGVLPVAAAGDVEQRQAGAPAGATVSGPMWLLARSRARSYSVRTVLSNSRP